MEKEAKKSKSGVFARLLLKSLSVFQHNNSRSFHLSSSLVSCLIARKNSNGYKLLYHLKQLGSSFI